MSQLFDPSHNVLTVWHHINKTGSLLKENMWRSQLYRRILLVFSIMHRAICLRGYWVMERLHCSDIWSRSDSLHKVHDQSWTTKSKHLHSGILEKKWWWFILTPGFCSPETQNTVVRKYDSHLYVGQPRVVHFCSDRMRLGCYHNVFKAAAVQTARQQKQAVVICAFNDPFWPDYVLQPGLTRESI